MIDPEIAACAERVRLADPDRFAASLLAGPADRAALWVLYAFNLEVARAPWASEQPLIGQMRLQFWTDVLDGITAGTPPRAHEVAAPLARLAGERALPLDALKALVAARERDALREPLADPVALNAYLEATAGGLMWAAARALGAPQAAEGAVRDIGTAAGLASWLAAQPALVARGWQPMPWADEDTLRSMAMGGLDRLAGGRQGRRQVPARARPAVLAGWQAEGRLRRVRRDPSLVAAGGLEGSEFARRAGLAWRALTGLW